MTLTSSSSASRCLRMTETAAARPSSVSTRCRSFSTCSRPSRSIRATVWLTVGPLWCSRSAIRARSGGTPSSSSSRMVRRYISVVSTRSFKMRSSQQRYYLAAGVGQAASARWRAYRTGDRCTVRRWPAWLDGTTAVVWDRALLGYDLGDHPLDPVRVELTMALARELGVLDRPGVRMITPRAGRRGRARPGAPARTTWTRCGRARATRSSPAAGLNTPDNPVFDAHARGQRAGLRRHPGRRPRRSGTARPPAR